MSNEPGPSNSSLENHFGRMGISDKPKTGDFSFKALLEDDPLKAGVSIGHLNLNVRLNPKNPETLMNRKPHISSFINENNWDIFGISDTSTIEGDNKDYTIVNYSLHKCDRPSQKKKEGGVCLYVKEDFKSKTLDIRANIQNPFPSYSSCLVVEVQSNLRHLKRPLIVSVLDSHAFKQKSDNNLFFETAFGSLCKRLIEDHQNADICILGDFNIDFLNTSGAENPGKKMTETALAFNLHQVISKATRNNNTTLQDPIFVNFQRNVIQSGIFQLSPDFVSKTVFIVMWYYNIEI